MRPVLPLALAAGLVIALAGCTAATPEGSTGSGDCAVVPSGAVSEAVTVSGDFGSKPEVTIDFPTSVGESTQRTVVIDGDGEVAEPGRTANVQFVLYNGATGEELAATDYTEAGLTPFSLDETFLPGLVETLECSTVGSRVVGVIPNAFGETGSADLGVEAGQDVVFVADVISLKPPVIEPLSRADGEDQAPVEGMPTVELDADGRPTITLPDTAPPTELELAVLKKGDGAVVEPGANVVVHYLGLNWNTNEIFDESWGRGAPATFNTQAVIAGFTQALEGQTVGSQVLVVIPPDLGYGPQGGSGDKIGATDTLVFVVDILGIA